MLTAALCTLLAALPAQDGGPVEDRGLRLSKQTVEAPSQASLSAMQAHAIVELFESGALRDLDATVERALGHVHPWVVQVSYQLPEQAQEGSGATEPPKASTCGFLLNTNGLVVAIDRGLQSAQRLAVRFVGRDGLRPRRARLLGVDPGMDLGLLDVGPLEGQTDPPVVMARHITPGLVVATTLLAGDPLASSCGILAERVADAEFGGRRYHELLKITAFGHVRMRGGVVAQVDGKIVGFLLPRFFTATNPGVVGNPGNSASASRFCFALPASAVRASVETVLHEWNQAVAANDASPNGADLVAGASAPTAPTRPWLGLTASEFRVSATVERGGWTGAQVTELFERGPALQAGLVLGDVIVSWNDSQVAGLDPLDRLLREGQPGELVQLGVMRAGRELLMPIRLGNW